jgi:hypothetical protein
MATRPAIGSITNVRNRRARVTSATNSRWFPLATSRDRDGNNTTASGTPMTPIGICRSVNA